MDALTSYRAASEANDVERLLATLAPDAEIVSPLSSRLVFRGRDDVRALLSAVYGSVRGLRWSEELRDGSTCVLRGTMRAGPFALDDAMVFELDSDGLIKRIRPHLRPWLATTFFALLLGGRMARHPGVLWRALRGGGAAEV